MPEGDTIHRAARTMQAAIGGRTIVRFDTTFPALARVDDQTAIAGQRVDAVEARGKHLLISLSGGLVLRTHMRMNGSWHLYRPGEAWQRRRADMRIVIETGDWVAVGFNVPEAEFVSADALERSAAFRRLGQDVLGTGFDVAEARRRMRSRPHRAIADVLLNQQVMAGIGNVYKSEILFIRGVNPFAAVDTLDDAALESIVATARKLLRHNVEHGEGGRHTRSAARGEDRLWVYGREGKPCRRCGSAIQMKKQGEDARVTFWCPKCQG